MEYWIDSIFLGPAVVGSLTLPASQHLRAVAVSLSSPFSNCVELNFIFCSLSWCLTCLVGSFCRESSAGLILGLVSLKNKVPTFLQAQSRANSSFKGGAQRCLLSPDSLSFQGVEAGDWLLRSSQSPWLFYMPNLGRDYGESFK